MNSMPTLNTPPGIFIRTIHTNKCNTQNDRVVSYYPDVVFLPYSFLICLKTHRSFSSTIDFGFTHQLPRGQ